MSSFFPKPPKDDRNRESEAPIMDSAPENIKDALNDLVRYLKPAHKVVDALKAGDIAAANKYGLDLEALLKEDGVLDKDKQAALMSLIMLAAPQVSPKLYGGGDKWNQ